MSQKKAPDLRYRRSTTRAGGLIAFGAAIASLFVVKPNCSTTGPLHCASYAFSQPWIFRVERAVLILVGLLIVFVLFVRIVIDGELPGRLSRYRISKQSMRMLNEVRRSLGRLRRALELTRAEEQESIRTTGALIGALDGRVAALEAVDLAQFQKTMESAQTILDVLQKDIEDLKQPAADPDLGSTGGPELDFDDGRRGLSTSPRVAGAIWARPITTGEEDQSAFETS